MKRGKSKSKNLPSKNHIRIKKVNKNRKSNLDYKCKLKLNKNENEKEGNDPSKSLQNKKDKLSESNENEKNNNQDENEDGNDDKSENDDDLYTISSYKNDDSSYEDDSDAHTRSNRKDIKHKLKKDEKVYKENKKKSPNNCICDRIKNLFNEKVDNYEIDFFRYLINLNDKNEYCDFVSFIISEFVKKIYSGEKEKALHVNNKFNKDIKTNNDEEIKNVISIKENIEFEYILNHDNKNLRNIFFLESIDIDFNKQKRKIFPFKSEIIIENIKKKEKKKKLNLKNQQNLSFAQKSTENKDELKIFIEKEELANRKFIYINDICTALNYNVIRFLYFLLICNYLSRDKKSNEKEKSNGIFDMKSIMEMLDEELSKNLTSENVFLNLCSPIIYLDFSDNINIVDFMSYFIDEISKNKDCNKNVENNDKISENDDNRDKNKFEKNKINDKNNNKNNQNNDEEINEYNDEKKVENGDKIKYIYELMDELISKCLKIFNGSLLGISICSYLNNFMSFNSSKKSRNFIFIYFVSEFMSKPVFVNIIEHKSVCKKLAWISFDNVYEKKEKEYIYLLICLLENKIKIYGISKYNFFINFFLSIENEEYNVEYLEKNLLKRKLKRLFTYKSNEILNDFSYTICIKNNKRFLRLAVCCNNFKIKIISIVLNEINKTKINNLIDKSKTINVSFQNSISDLPFIFKQDNNTNENEGEQMNKKNEYELKNEREAEEMNIKEKENIRKEDEVNVGKEKRKRFDECMSDNEFKKKNTRINSSRIHINLNNEKKEKKKISIENYEISVYEDFLYLQHGILSLCSFYPSINSYLLCVCSKEGNVVIIDIRNNNELIFFKRKTETVSHLKWYNNSCILFGQDKGCILHLFENKYILNIDKMSNNLIEILCLNSFLMNDTFMFTFDDGTILRGKLKKSKTKVKYNEFFKWSTKNFELNPQVLLKISCMKNEQAHSVSLILLYEYLQGLQNIFNNGIRIIKSKKFETKISKKTIALTPKS